MPAPARIAAFQALRAIATGRADLPGALATSRQQLRDDRDRALTADIVTGTLRWQRSVDHLVLHFARRPIDDIDPDVLDILRLSLYQLLHLDRVPASAVVDDAVDLARHAKKAHASGFVNAVLRATLRERHRLPFPPRPAEPARRDQAVGYLGITHSHPEWLVGRWVDRHGFEAAERWVQFNNEPPQLMLRANTLRLTRDLLASALAADGVDTTPARYAPEGLMVTSGNPLRGKNDGSFFVQEEASQLVALVLDAQPEDTVLDLCASPGGKTTAIAAAMRDRGRLVASDVRARRMRLLRSTVIASGARCVRIVQIAGTGSLPFQPVFDRILIDAPCSGLGTIRRDPDIRWRRTPADLADLAARQLELLQRATIRLKPGGRLVYATCSSEPQENEQVVDAFLSNAPDFTLLDLRAAPPGTLAPSHLHTLAPFLDSRGMFRTLPFAHGLEAFFAAAIVRGTISDR